jgi:hypothetical protein
LSKPEVPKRVRKRGSWYTLPYLPFSINHYDDDHYCDYDDDDVRGDDDD